MRKLTNCHDCNAKPGQPHMSGCDTEQCSVCGSQWIQCGHEDHDPLFARWTGIWPREAECLALGLYSKWVDGTGWVTCDKNDPDGDADLNEFARKGYAKIFFIKPKEKK